MREICLLSLLAMAAVACGDDAGDDDTVTEWLGPEDEELGDIAESSDAAIAEKAAAFRAGVITASKGFREGARTAYWRFETNTDTPNVGGTADLYSFIYADSGERVLEQYAVIDQVPGDDGYSPFWRVITVEVPPEYPANALKTVDSILAAEADGQVTLFPTNNAFNCPIVAEGATLEGNPEGDLAIRNVEFWYKGYEVVAFDFAFTANGAQWEGLFAVTEPGHEFPRAPMYGLFRDPDGVAGDHTNGNEARVADQNIIEEYPPDSAYSPLWQVSRVYVAPFEAGGPSLVDTTGSDESDFESVDDIEAAQLAGSASAAVVTDVIFNCPARPGEPLDP